MWDWNGARRTLAIGGVSLACLAVPGAARGAVHWSAGYEGPAGPATADALLAPAPGDWDFLEVDPDAPDGDRITFNQSVVREGTSSARFQLRPTDFDGTGNRVEVLASTNTIEGREGEEAWYGWSTRFPSGFDATTTSTIFTQFHSTGGLAMGRCGPPVTLIVFPETQSTPPEFRLRVQGGTYTGNACRLNRDDWWRVALDTPFAKNVWYDFALHVRWSTKSTKDFPAAEWESAGVGFVELYVNGVAQNLSDDGDPPVYRRYSGTLYDDKPTNNLKQGLYRDPAGTLTSYIFHDAVRFGDSLSDVTPGP